MPVDTVTQTQTTSASADTSVAGASAPNPVQQGTSGQQSTQTTQSSTSKTEDVLRARLAGMVDNAGGQAAQPKQEGNAASPTTSEPVPKAGEAQGSAAKSGTEAQPDVTKSPDYEKAYNAMRRSRMPIHAIKAMKPETVIEVGLNMAEAQAENDRRWNQVTQQARSGTSKSQNPPVGANAGKNDNSAAQPADGQGNQPAEPNGQPATQKKTGESNPAGAKPWEAFIGQLQADPVIGPMAPQFEQVFQAMDAHYAQQLAAIQTGSQNQSRMLEDMALALDQSHLDRTRAQLQGSYDVLTDDSNWNAVQERAYLLAETGKYTKDGKVDWPKLVKDSVRLEFGDVIETKLKTTTRTEFQQQAAGQITRTDVTKTPNQALTAEQKALKATELLREGKTPAEVQRLLAAG
jgi:hypothetical protein